MVHEGVEWGGEYRRQLTATDDTYYSSTASTDYGAKYYSSTYYNAGSYYSDSAGACLTIKMRDGYGDGWNGGTYFIINEEGEVAASGTLWGGQAGTHYLCDVVGECFTMSVSEGTYPTEISWEVIIGGAVFAQGSGGDTANGLCVDEHPTTTPTSTPVPTITSRPTARPTWTAFPKYRALSALYAGALGYNVDTYAMRTISTTGTRHT